MQSETSLNVSLEEFVVYPSCYSSQYIKASYIKKTDVHSRFCPCNAKFNERVIR